MRTSTTAILAAATLAVACPTAPAAADPIACQREIVKRSAELVQLEAKELQRCEERAREGGGACPDARAAAKIAKVQSKLRAAIGKRCGGDDRACGTPDDEPLAAIGWDLGTCPAPPPAACEGALADCGDVADCLACADGHGVARAIGLYYDALAAGGDGAVGKCRRVIGKEGAKLLRERAKVLRACRDDVLAGKASGPCPDARAAARIARAEAKLVQRLCKACGGGDRACGTGGDDVPPDAIGFPAQCPAVMPPGAASCAASVDSLPALVECVRCVTAFETDCLGALPAPALGAYPPECRVGPGGGGVTHVITDGPTECTDALVAFFIAAAGDTIEFGEGAFECATTLVMSHKEGITVRGQGMDKTVLDFLGSHAPEGLSFSHMTGITVEDLTVIDTPGFSIKISDSHHVVLRNVRAMWSSADGPDPRGGMDPTMPSTLDVTCIHALSFPESAGTYVDRNGVSRPYVTDGGNGGYAIYPVLSDDVLLDNVIALGASDAGIYVGQSNDIVVRNSEALFNVAGFEIENSDNADVGPGNVAHCNTGGFLTFDLPGLNQYGDRTRTFDNYAGYNNTPNFAPGGIVRSVPQGVGFLQLGYDEHEVFGNTIEWNRTVGFVFVSHELLGGSSDLRMDYYPEAIHLHDNVFTTNGTLPQPPQPEAIICQPGTGGDTGVPCIPAGVDDGHPSLLPALIQLKGTLALDGFGPTGAHVVWDGMLDLTSNGCALAPELAGIVDANGKPQYTGQHSPTCRYNDYKFTDPGDPATRRHPAYWSCITDQGDPGGNTFSPDSRKYLNFENTDPLDPPLTDVDAHDCPGRFGTQLAPLPAAVVEEYVPGAGGEPPPSQAEIDAICASFGGDQINRAALPFNCRWLSQYNLFADPTDPRAGAHEGGILFDLTTPLFSDYAVKYRFLFLPPGAPAGWRAGDAGAPNATLDLPVGTVLAKTFAFRSGADEEIVETRLLIHRETGAGDSFWEGMAFIWETDAGGNRADARLAVAGGTAAVAWDYEDPDPDVTATYTGATDAYAVPHANQCGSCHSNADREPGDAPIGLKVRLLNRPIDPGTGPVNQLRHWIDSGRLAGAPPLAVDASHVATNVPRAPRFNVAGDWLAYPSIGPLEARFDAMTAGERDLEMRARAWLESNCAHCHNQNGLAQSSGVFLDVFRTVDLNYGICKTPTTAGSSSGGRSFDIVPGSADGSILSFRIHEANPSTQMPPIARSVAHDEGVSVIDEWIDTVVDGDYAGAGCEQ